MPAYVVLTHMRPMPNLENLKKQAKRARLNLRCVSRPAIDPQWRDEHQLLAATITLDDAKPLFLEFQAAGVVFHQPLRTEPWGARTFIVRDPDGNLLLFAGPGS